MKQWLLGFCLLLLPCVAEAQSVANNTALQAACTASSGCPGGDPVFTGGVWRLAYGLVNGSDNGASPLFYLPQASACSLNSGNGDNGLQVKSADGKCWLARFPGIGADILQFGADPQGSSDSTTAIQNAFNDLPSNGYSVIIPAGIFLHIYRLDDTELGSACRLCAENYRVRLAILYSIDLRPRCDRS